MNMIEANQLSRIYNTLLLVKTSGEDTVIMGRCLDAFQQFLSQATIVENEVEINNNLNEEV